MESIRKNGHPNGPGCDINKYVWREGLKFYLMRKYPNLFSNESLMKNLGRIPDKNEQVGNFTLSMRGSTGNNSTKNKNNHAVRG